MAPAARRCFIRFHARSRHRLWWRALRAVSIGRKNYLFFGADSGGERAASFYTLIGTAKLCGLDPSLYLRTVLAQISDHLIHRIGELLPWNLAANLHPESASAA